MGRECFSWTRWGSREEREGRLKFRPRGLSRGTMGDDRENPCGFDPCKETGVRESAIWRKKVAKLRAGKT